MRVLMSFCNLGHFNSQFSLAVLNTEGEPDIRLVDCSAFMEVANEVGITGLCRLPGGGLALAVQSSKSKIVFLDEDWTVRRIVRDPRFADVHSIMERDGFLFVVSTGCNKIMKVDISTFAVSLYWEYPVDTPFLHINALQFEGDRPIASSHKIPPEAEGGGVSGGVWRLDDYEVLIEGLKQPHTLTLTDAGMICLSSHDERVVSRVGGEIASVETPGYLRGMLIDEGRVLLGVSSRRFVSRKRSGVYKYANFAEVVGNPVYMSSLMIADTDFRPLRNIDTTPVGFEIYDVIPDPGVPEQLLTGPYASVRMQTMERQIISLREKLERARNPEGEA